MIVEGLVYTKQHEWVKVESNIVTVGITDYAQMLLGEIVFVELPVVGTEVISEHEMAVVESTKAASDIFAPVAGIAGTSAAHFALASLAGLPVVQGLHLFDATHWVWQSVKITKNPDCRDCADKTALTPKT